MAFFVPLELLERQQERNQKRSDPIERTDLLLLANGKKMGLSFSEINTFRVRDFIEFTDIYFAGESSGNTHRTATQADIDALLS